MKLANYLSKKISIVFIIIFLIWSVVYFFFQMNEIYDGIDEGLNNLKQEFILKANESHGFIENMEKYHPINMIVDKIPYKEAINFKETYLTTKVYFPTEEENEEVRMLITVFKCNVDNEYYILRFFTSTVESDDLIKNILYLLIALWVCLGLTIFFVNRKIIDRTNRPLLQLLSSLANFQLGNNQMIEFPETIIKEYKQLNNSVERLLNENIQAYTEQKNFIENASHELQTPLAIVINKLELLIQEKQLKEEHISVLGTILTDLNRMKRLNSSLLLLSKIKNKQYADNEQVDLYLTFKKVLDNFDELIKFKNITLNITNNGHPTLLINPDLAHIIASNLLKNAISHNVDGGFINILFDSEKIIIENDGPVVPYNTNIFERYRTFTDNKQSSGLGLAIVKSIVDHYGLNIIYQYSGVHIITFNLK